MAQEQKKRRGRRAYLDDYKALANGQIVYTGKMYAYAGGKPWEKVLAVLWLWAGVALACVITCGLIPVSGMKNTAYVVLPWVLSFVGAASVIWALVRVTHHGEELKEHVYTATVRALPVRTVFTAVCAAVAVLGQTVKLILDGPGEAPWADICFLPLMLLAAVLSGAARFGLKDFSFALRP